QCQLPQRGHVAEHEQNPIAAPHTERAQVRGEEVGAAAQLVEREADIEPALVDDPERGPRVATGDDIEPVERPVEIVRTRPAEATARGCIVGAVCEEKVAPVTKLLGRIHLQAPLVGIGKDSVSSPAWSCWNANITCPI